MSELRLPVLPAAPPAITRDRYAVLARRVKLLSWLSLAWMTVEGAVAIAAGIAAGSIALGLLACARACVCDLGWIVARDEKLVSHHLRLLQAAGLARSERDGKMVMYELTARGRALLAAVAAAEPVR
ncbi:MAG TPA: helix-turn-helix domain-containing protein [Solirubrobacteraceae bacterium]|nr:helix-turn-helix domain-containing protein [Solirubrobacteraceae bacterium]